MNLPWQTLRRDAFGRLVLTDLAGKEHVGVIPVRAFPLVAPSEGVGVTDDDGNEVAWVPNLAELPAEARALLEESLAQREFMPEIRHLRAVSSYGTPSTWSVETDRGATQFVLAGEEHIHRMTGGLLLVNDAHGVQYLIRDRDHMDRASRRLLDHFL